MDFDRKCGQTIPFPHQPYFVVRELQEKVPIFEKERKDQVLIYTILVTKNAHPISK